MKTETIVVCESCGGVQPMHVSPRVSCPSSQAFEEVCDAAIVHLGQNVWTHEMNDREFLHAKGVSYSARNELRGWIAFQRAYKAAPGNLSDGQKHQWACENAQSYEVADDGRAPTFSGRTTADAGPPQQ